MFSFGSGGGDSHRRGSGGDAPTAPRTVRGTTGTAASTASDATDALVAELDSALQEVKIKDLPQAQRASLAAMFACVLSDAPTPEMHTWAHSFLKAVCKSYLFIPDAKFHALEPLIQDPPLEEELRVEELRFAETAYGLAASAGSGSGSGSGAGTGSGGSSSGGVATSASASGGDDALDALRFGRGFHIRPRKRRGVFLARAFIDTVGIDADARRRLFMRLLVSLVTDSAYDARARVVFQSVAAGLSIPWREAAAVEDALVTKIHRELVAAEEAKQRKSSGRWWKVGLAAVGGGALLVLTAGLAAPALIAGVATVGAAVPAVLGGGAITSLATFAASSAGYATLLAVVGASGSGLAGSRMAHRTDSLAVFRFERLPFDRAAATAAAAVAAAADAATTDAGAQTDKAHAAASGGDGAVKSTAAIAIPTSGSTSQADAALTLPDGRPVPPPSDGMQVFVCVSGWCEAGIDDELIDPWEVDLATIPRRHGVSVDRRSDTQRAKDASKASSADAKAAAERLKEAEAMAEVVVAEEAAAEGAGVDDESDSDDDGGGAAASSTPVTASEQVDDDTSASDKPSSSSSSSSAAAEAAASGAGADVSLSSVDPSPQSWWAKQIPHGERYALVWEPKTLAAAGSAVKDFALSQIQGKVIGEVLKQTALASLMAAWTWPSYVVSACSFIDTPWIVALDRADKAGVALADLLFKREHGHRPITLCGYSFGARVVFKCCQELARRGEKGLGIVQDCLLIGAMVPGDIGPWREVRRVVAGRIISCYSPSDWLLKLVYRFQSMTYNVAGIGPVGVKVPVDPTGTVPAELTRAASSGDGSVGSADDDDDGEGDAAGAGVRGAEGSDKAAGSADTGAVPTGTTGDGAAVRVVADGAAASGAEGSAGDGGGSGGGGDADDGAAHRSASAFGDATSSDLPSPADAAAEPVVWVPGKAKPVPLKRSRCVVSPMGIENYDVSDIVPRHYDYALHLKRILRRVRLER